MSLVLKDLEEMATEGSRWAAELVHAIRSLLIDKRIVDDLMKASKAHGKALLEGKMLYVGVLAGGYAQPPICVTTKHPNYTADQEDL